MGNYEPPCYRAALDYIDRGLSVIPLQPGTKAPATKRGLRDWSDNPEQARFWWGVDEYEGQGDPQRGVAIVCGQCSHGIIVIDVDVHDVDGLATLREWELTHGKLPETWTAITGSGGRHYYYRSNREIKPKPNTTMGIDVRGDGSYVMAPPTIHPNGEPTEWSISPEDIDLADADDNVYELIEMILGGALTSDPKSWDKLERKKEVREGQGRNDYLYRYGCSQRAKKHSKDETAALMRNENALVCKPPLDEEELQAVIRSACSKPIGTTAEKEGRAPESPALDDDGTKLPNFRGRKGGIKSNLLAQAVMQKFKARYIDGAPAVWTGRHWEFGKNAIEWATLELADDAKRADRAEVLGYITTKCSRNGYNSDKDFDGHYYVQFKNCTYRITKDAFTEVEPDPSMFIVGELAIDFDLDAAKRNYADDFLLSTAAGDPQVCQALAEIVGVCMCSKILVPASPMLIGRAGGEGGTASNGKSTFINMLRALLGSHNVSSLDLSVIGERFQAASLLGKLANLGDDISSAYLNEMALAMFKKLVTGDTISTDIKNADRIEFKPTATFIYSMNEIPRFKTLTGGELRRMYFVPFRARFAPGEPSYDPHVAEKLAQPEVLNRMAYIGMSAAQLIMQRGEAKFIDIDGMDAEIENLKLDNDTVRAWVHENGVTAESLHQRPTSAVYIEYRDWCREAGNAFPVSQTTFTKRVAGGAVEVQPGAQLIAKMGSVGGKKCRRFYLIAV